MKIGIDCSMNGALVLAMIAAAVADPPTRGPYATGFKVFQA